MKTRLGFVSNSSSSSFVMAVAPGKTIKEMVKKYFGYDADQKDFFDLNKEIPKAIAENAEKIRDNDKNEDYLPEEILKKIREEYEAIDFLEEARQNPKIIEKFIPKAEQEVFKKILTEKKDKEKITKKTITIKSLS